MSTEDEVRVSLRCPECKHEFTWGMSSTEALEQASMFTAAAQFEPGRAFVLPPTDGRTLGVKGGSDGGSG